MAAMPKCTLGALLLVALLPLVGAAVLLDVPLVLPADEALPLIVEDDFSEDAGFELVAADEVDAPDVMLLAVVVAEVAAEDIAVALAVALPLASDDALSTVFFDSITNCGV